LEFELSNGAPHGIQFSCTENGWITSEVFVEWLKGFVSSVKPRKEEKFLVILDGHSTHIRNPEANGLPWDTGLILHRWLHVRRVASNGLSQFLGLLQPSI
jgi:hypothetical protein